MMTLNGQLYTAGFFGIVAQRVVRVAHTPRGLLALIIVASGTLSALFLNDTIVLMLTPLVLDTTRALRRNPIPYLIGLATGANVGSTATITGNPQNMIIGSASGLSYTTFVAALAPTALIGLAICWLVIVLVYPQEFRRGRFETPEVGRMRVYRPLLRKVAVVVPIMLALMILGCAGGAGCISGSGGAARHTTPAPGSDLENDRLAPAGLFCGSLRSDRQPSGAGGD